MCYQQVTSVNMLGKCLFPIPQGLQMSDQKVHKYSFIPTEVSAVRAGGHRVAESRPVWLEGEGQ